MINWSQCRFDMHMYISLFDSDWNFLPRTIILKFSSSRRSFENGDGLKGKGFRKEKRFKMSVFGLDSIQIESRPFSISTYFRRWNSLTSVNYGFDVNRSEVFTFRSPHSVWFSPLFYHPFPLPSSLLPSSSRLFLNSYSRARSSSSCAVWSLFEP